MNTLRERIVHVVEFLFSLLEPNVTVIVEPPEISGNVSDVAINLTCRATLMENIVGDYYLVWYLDRFPINDESARIVV